MKKFMVADLIKEIEEEAEAEDQDFEISIGNVEAEWDETNQNYVVNIYFDRGGSAEYIMDQAELDDFVANPTGSYYNANIRLS